MRAGLVCNFDTVSEIAAVHQRLVIVSYIVGDIVAQGSGYAKRKLSMRQQEWL